VAIGDPTCRDYLRKTEGDLNTSCSQRHKNLFGLRIKERMAEPPSRYRAPGVQLSLEQLVDSVLSPQIVIACRRRHPVDARTPHLPDLLG
jgi:hypothetical protein